MLQNFRFYDDGVFEVHFSNPDEDLRGIYALRGKYRLNKTNLYLTILYRTVIEGGKITTPDPGESFKLFQIEDGNYKEIKEVNPKELAEPILIKLIGKDQILLGCETYYKLPWEDLKKINILPTHHR